MACTCAPALVKLRTQVDARWPDRDRSSEVESQRCLALLRAAHVRRTPAKCALCTTSGGANPEILAVPSRCTRSIAIPLARQPVADARRSFQPQHFGATRESAKEVASTVSVALHSDGYNARPTIGIRTCGVCTDSVWLILSGCSCSKANAVRFVGGITAQIPRPFTSIIATHQVPSEGCCAAAATLASACSGTTPGCWRQGWSTSTGRTRSPQWD